MAWCNLGQRKTSKHSLDIIKPSILSLSLARNVPFISACWNDHKFSYRDCILNTLVEFLSKLNSKDIPLACYRDHLYLYAEIDGCVKWYNCNFQFVKFLRVLVSSQQQQARMCKDKIESNCFMDTLNKSDVSYIREKLIEWLFVKRVGESSGNTEKDFTW